MESVSWAVEELPRPLGKKPGRVLFVDQSGDVWGTRDSAYRGDAGPLARAARRVSDGDEPGTYVGLDGNVWRRVN